VERDLKEANVVEQLTAEARKTALKELSGWKEVAGRDAIERTFVFRDFNEAFGFMSRAAIIRNGATSTRRSRWCCRPTMPVA
jgi:pterin-4a-carbinolamine dehydratase